MKTWKKKTILDYYKEVLMAVSFDSELYDKEYEKAMLVLAPLERIQLDIWLCDNYRCKRVG